MNCALSGGMRGEGLGEEAGGSGTGVLTCGNPGSTGFQPVGPPCPQKLFATITTY